MPLPNFGFQNKEKKEHQELKFQMAPEYVDVEVDSKLSGMHTVKYLRIEYVHSLKNIPHLPLLYKVYDFLSNKTPELSVD